MMQTLSCDICVPATDPTSSRSVRRSAPRTISARGPSSLAADAAASVSLKMEVPSMCACGGARSERGGSGGRDAPRGDVRGDTMGRGVVGDGRGCGESRRGVGGRDALLLPPCQDNIDMRHA